MRPPGLARTTTPRHTSIVLPVHSTSGRRGWALSISTASWVARPISGHPTFIAITPRYFRGSASPAIISQRSGGRGDQVYEESECVCAGQTVLSLLRARRHPFAAPTDKG